MIKALLKKQLLEFFSGISLKGKKSSQNKKGKTLGAAVLFCFIILLFSAMFFSMAYMMSPVLDSDEEWLYFSVFGILSSLMGIFGSVFMAYTSLYAANDNDMLLAMPIPPAYILFSRIAGLYISTLCFQAMVYIPCVIVYCIIKGIVLSVTLLSVVSFLVLPVLSLSVSFVLGFVIALFSAKIRNKSAITVVFSIIFLLVYYALSFRFSSVVNKIVLQPAETGEFIKKYLYLFYAFGKGNNGNIALFLLFTLFCIGIFFVIYKSLSRSFISLATTEKGIKHKAYKEKKMRQSLPAVSFFRKEFLFFRSTPVYILNCSMGSVMMLIFSVFSLVKNREIPLMLEVAGVSSEKISVYVGLALCFFAATNNLTSVSVSLEGRGVEFLHSVPCSIRDVFAGKLMLHTVVTIIPLVISNIILAVAYKTNVLTLILLILMSTVFTFVCAASGLVVNLLFPKMEWVNVTVPIKQSLSSLLGMFAGIVISLIVILPYFALMGIVSDDIYLIVMIILLSAVSLLLCRWLAGKGAEKFSEL